MAKNRKKVQQTERMRRVAAGIRPVEPGARFGRKSKKKSKTK